MNAFMSRFKISARIMTGFAIVIALLAIVAIVSYRASSDTAEAVDELNRMANNTIVVGNVDRMVVGMRRNVLSFIAKGEKKYINAVQERQLAIVKNTKSLIENTNNAERKQDYAKLIDIANGFATDFDKLVAAQTARDQEIETGIDAIGTDLRRKMGKISDSATADGRFETAARAGATQESLLLARLAVSRFVADPTEAKAKKASERLVEFSGDITKLIASTNNPTRKQLAQEVAEGGRKYEQSFKKVAELAMLVDKMDTETLTEKGRQMNELAAKVKDAQSKRMAEIKTNTDDSIDGSQRLIMILSLGALAFGVAAALIISRGITVPVGNMTAAMTELAGGKLETEVPARDNKDEIGDMAAAVQVFKENAIRVKQMEEEQREAERRAAEERKAMMHQMADDFEASVGHIVQSVSSAATETQTASQTLSATAEQTSQQASAVAAASEQASANVQTVATATEELSGSIQEIGRQVTQSSQIAGRAVDQANRTDQQVQGLAAAAQKIGEVVSLISDIAEQTNLLALNATIEAARAGDAGKGFAVVASEVKSLANQTARATEDISQQIGGIQAETQEAVTAIQSIGATINEMSEIASAIASAVEEQSAATGEIARNVEQAAVGTQEVSGNIGGVTQAAAETGTAAGQILGAASDLAKQSETLSAEVGKFLAQVRAG